MTFFFIVSQLWGTNITTSESEPPWDKPRSLALTVNQPPCSPAVVGTVPGFSCNPFPLIHRYEFLPAQVPCCWSNKGNDLASRCKMKSFEGGANCTEHDGRILGIAENALREIWQHLFLDLEILRKKTQERPFSLAMFLFYIFFFFKFLISSHKSSALSSLGKWLKPFF